MLSKSFQKLEKTANPQLRVELDEKEMQNKENISEAKTKNFHTPENVNIGLYKCGTEEFDDLQIIIERVRAVTIKTPLTVQGIQAKAIVDTGAEVTVLSEQLYNSFPVNLKPRLQKAKRGLIVAEAGREMKTCGIIDVDFEIGEYKFSWPVYVAPIRDEILLGCDLIDEMDITVTTKRGIQIKDTWVDCEVIRIHENTGQVKVSRAVTVPASSEFIMTGICDTERESENQTYIFEASEEARTKLLIARSVIKIKSNRIPVKMINPNVSPIKLKKGMVLGNIQPVGSVMPTRKEPDITTHEEGISLCRLKSHETSHERVKLEGISSYQKEKDIRA